VAASVVGKVDEDSGSNVAVTVLIVIIVLVVCILLAVVGFRFRSQLSAFFLRKRDRGPGQQQRDVENPLGADPMMPMAGAVPMMMPVAAAVPAAAPSSSADPAQPAPVAPEVDQRPTAEPVAVEREAVVPPAEPKAKPKSKPKAKTKAKAKAKDQPGGDVAQPAVPELAQRPILGDVDLPEYADGPPNQPPESLLASLLRSFWQPSQTTAASPATDDRVVVEIEDVADFRLTITDQGKGIFSL
jgi:hypothetical protein